MRVTLDHNCIIHLKDRTDVGIRLERIVRAGEHQCFVVNIGASEMRDRGVRPDRFDMFEELLLAAGIAHLPRLEAMLVWGVSFWGRSFWASPDAIKMFQELWSILFGKSPPIDVDQVGLDSKEGRKWLNQACDVESLRSHIAHGNDVFLTTDGNFTKQSKLSALLALGAGRICDPREL